MTRSNASLVFSITLLFSIFDLIALQCVEETSCSCHLSDGTFYDLNELSAKGPLRSTTYNQTYVFSFQPCKNVKMDLMPDIVTGCNNGTGVSLCAMLNDTTPVSLGNTTETKWKVGESGTALVLHHPPYTTQITLLCCHECATSSLSFDNKLQEFKYHLVLNTPFACKHHEQREGLSVGSILLILVLVFGGLYFVIGALVLRFMRGAIGWELIPNYDFWCSLPGLCRIQRLAQMAVLKTSYVVITASRQQIIQCLDHGGFITEPELCTREVTTKSRNGRVPESATSWC